MNKKRVTKNQIELMKIIHSFRYIPVKVLLIACQKAGLYQYRESLSVALKKLQDHGWIESVFYGNKWKVVYLTSTGAKKLADALVLHYSNVKVIYPPDGIKDLRQWLRAGLSTETLLNLIRKTKPIGIRIIVKD